MLTFSNHNYVNFTTRISDVTDGTSTTVIVGEVTESLGCNASDLDSPIFPVWGGGAGAIPSAVTPTAPNGNEMKATVDLYESLREHGADMTRVRVVVTRAAPTGRVGIAARDHLRSLDVATCTTIIRAYAAFQRAEEQQILVQDVRDERSANAWADVCALALEVS
jgi:hypothetical protein